MLVKIKRWLVEIVLRLLENRSIRTWLFTKAMRSDGLARKIRDIISKWEDETSDRQDS